MKRAAKERLYHALTVIPPSITVNLFNGKTVETASRIYMHARYGNRWWYSVTWPKMQAALSTRGCKR